MGERSAVNPALLLARCLVARRNGVPHVAGALGLIARHLRRLHDSRIYCATIAATMQMPVPRIALPLVYATDRRRPPATASDCGRTIM
jgi:hypothetical protein